MAEFETLTPDWLSASDAVSRILSRVRVGRTEIVPVSDAPGRVLAEEVRAGVTLPPWDNSAMDGYAVRGEDVAGASEEEPVRLRVTGEIRAGDVERREVEEGEAVRIMTGAPIPPGADTVIRVEHTDAEEGGDGVRILSDADLHRHIRPGGEDLSEGDLLLRPGTRLDPGRVALLAGSGRERIEVFRRPRVAVLSSGDELAGPDRWDEVAEGRAIPETNGPALVAAVREAGGIPVPLGIARDTEQSVRDHVLSAGESDALITSGGASMGAGDLFKRVLDRMGFELDFWRVRIRPGTPFSLGSLPLPGRDEPLPIYGLPGNPASAFVTFQVLVRPAILARGGHDRVHRAVIQAILEEELTSPVRLTHFFRVRLDGSWSEPSARLTGPQGSGLIQSLGTADGLAVVPEEVERIPRGEAVSVMLLREGPGWSRKPGY